MKPNRRAILGAGLAGVVGFATAPLGAHEGTLTDQQFRDLAYSPRTAEEYIKLATHVRKLVRGAEADSRLYTAIAAGYREGLPGVNASQSAGAARAVEHAALHNADLAEALRHLAEHYEGLAERFEVASGA